jgi:Cu/Zn superoxide dismutase
MCAMPATSLAQYSTMAPTTAPMMSGGSSITVPLKALNNSGETGTATLTQKGDDILVAVKMNNPTSANQPIHIHPGTCANLNPKPQYPLKNVADGSSTTTLTGMKLSSLQTGNFAINVHKSTDEVGTYVACGDIPKAG